MENINNLLFVIENYKGKSEHNMLSTKKEFMNFLSRRGLSEFAEDIDFLLSNKNTRVQWNSLNTFEGLLEFRSCRDEQDLCNFLDGKYNDSLEKMTDRNLHTFGPFNMFKWDVNVSSFSPASLSLLNSLKRKSTFLNERCETLFSKKSSLDDIIKNCVQNQSIGIKQGEPRVKPAARNF